MKKNRVIRMVPVLIASLGLGSLRTTRAEDKTAIQLGSSVTLHYTLTVDGAVVDSSRGRAPLTYIQGSGQVIPGMEEELLGAKAGEKKHIVIPPNKGYGHVDPDAIRVVPKKSFKQFKNLKIGSVVTGQFDGRAVQARVVGMDKKNVVLDLNHPLAEKTLEFDIEILSVQPPRRLLTK